MTAKDPGATVSAEMMAPETGVAGPDSTVATADARYRSLPLRSSAPLYWVSGLVLLGLGAVLGFVVVVAGAALDASDRPIGEWFFALSGAHEALRQFAFDFAVIGSGHVTAPLAVVVGVLLFAFRRWRWGVWFATVSIGGPLISETFKFSVQRARPVWESPLATESSFSYPSGHTLSGVTTWVAIGVVALFVLPRPWSSVLGVVFLVVGVLMGPSRLLLGVHWLTDVLGGWLFGFGWLLFVSGIALRKWGVQSEHPQRELGGTGG